MTAQIGHLYLAGLPHTKYSSPIQEIGKYPIGTCRIFLKGFTPYLYESNTYFQNKKRFPTEHLSKNLGSRFGHGPPFFVSFFKSV